MSTENSYTPSIHKNNEIFNQIGIWYDLLCKMFTFGYQFRWYNSVSQLLLDKGPLRILDVGCGTGQQITSIINTKVPIISITGIDISENMLQRAYNIIRHRLQKGKIFLIRTDMHNLHFQNDFFDAVTMSFALNFSDNHQILFKEICRVLKKDSPFLILDFFPTKRNILFSPVSFYLNYVIPLIGGLISGSSNSIKKISSTFCTTPPLESLEIMLRLAGFKKFSRTPLFPGFISIISCKKSTSTN